MSASSECIFCFDSLEGNEAVEGERVLHEFEYWWLVQQPEVQRRKTIRAAGMLVAKRHFEVVSLATPKEWDEVKEVMHRSGIILCEAVGMEYTGQTRLGFNEGSDVGQTVEHAHIHVLPQGDADPLWERAGIMGAFTELHSARMVDDDRPSSQ